MGGSAKSLSDGQTQTEQLAAQFGTQLDVNDAWVG